MTTRRPPQEASPLAAEADPSPEIQYLVEPERRMSDLSSEKPDGAKRFSTRGNWHMRPRVASWAEPSTRSTTPPGRRLGGGLGV